MIDLDFVLGSFPDPDLGRIQMSEYDVPLLYKDDRPLLISVKL